jgi:hypothetical protein
VRDVVLLAKLSQHSIQHHGAGLMCCENDDVFIELLGPSHSETGI